MGHAAKGIFIGNLLLIVCCIFYLLWWILAFKPTDPIKGFRSGWLLIPAIVAGASGFAMAVRGILLAKPEQAFIPLKTILLAAIIAYFFIAVFTWAFFKRPVTTELFLIIAWTALMVSEADTLCGIGIYSYPKAVAFIVETVIIALASLAAYIAYYKLDAADAAAGFVDGMLPLIFTAISTAAASVAIFL